MAEIEIPVLVVGAGPAGLTAALTLATYGVEVLLVDRRRGRSALPRATVVSTRSMELLRGWGLEPAVLAGAVEVEWKQWVCETLAAAASGSAWPTGYPSTEQSVVVSPSAPACVPQDHLEPVLLERLRTLAPAGVEFGVELVGLRNGPDGVAVDLRDIATGLGRTVRARYLLAADGAHSTVRELLDVPMRGPDDLQDVVSVLFRAPLWDVLGHVRYGLYGVTAPGAEGVFLPAGRGDRWLYNFPAAGSSTGSRAGSSTGSPAGSSDGSSERVGAVDVAGLVERIRVAAGMPTLEPRIERLGRYSFAAQLADRFADGSTFLVGDAAHRVTPRGGTGLNIAIHDGYDLGWKLAWVLQGWAGATLLDSYETERRPVAEHNAARSADPLGARRPPEVELRADLGGRIPHVWLEPTDRRVSTLDLLGSAVTAFTGPGGVTADDDPLLREAAVRPGSPPLVVRRLDAMSARALGITAGRALVVRPDGLPIDHPLAPIMTTTAALTAHERTAS